MLTWTRLGINLHDVNLLTADAEAVQQTKSPAAAQVDHVRAGSLTVIANICSASGYVPLGDDSESQSTIDAGVLPLLLGLLHGDLTTDR